MFYKGIFFVKMQAGRRAPVPENSQKKRFVKTRIEYYTVGLFDERAILWGFLTKGLILDRILTNLVKRHRRHDLSDDHYFQEASKAIRNAWSAWETD